MNAVAFPLLSVSDSGEVSLQHGGRSREEIRDAILELKDQLLGVAGESMDLPVDHEFCDGMYVRTLHIPKGTLLVGKIHRQPCINWLAKGEMSLLTEFGSTRVKAGFMAQSKAGIQKLGYAHEDSVFVNVFRTNETDIARIEQVVACESYEAVNAHEVLT